MRLTLSEAVAAERARLPRRRVAKTSAAESGLVPETPSDLNAGRKTDQAGLKAAAAVLVACMSPELEKAVRSAIAAGPGTTAPTEAEVASAATYLDALQQALEVQLRGAVQKTARPVLPPGKPYDLRDHRAGRPAKESR